MMKLTEQLKYLCCPRDHQELAQGNNSLVCRSCGHEYPVHYNIPNFTFDGKVHGKRITRLSTYPDDNFLNDWEELSYRDLVTKYWNRYRPEWKMYRRKWPDLSDDELKSKVAFMWAKARLESVDQGIEILSRIETMIGPIDDIDCCIDIACGSAMLMSALIGKSKCVIGIDLDWKDLLLGAKLMHEQGHQNFALCFGYAEALPFRNATADVVTMNWAMEHIRNKDEAQREIARVHNRKNFVYINNVNRFRLIEPHTGVPLVGYLPKPLWNTYVKMMANRPYSPRQYSPIGFIGFNRLLKRHYSDYEVSFWHDEFSGPILKKLMDSNRLFKIRPIQRLLKLLRLLTYKTYFAVLYPHGR